MFAKLYCIDPSHCFLFLSFFSIVAATPSALFPSASPTVMLRVVPARASAAVARAAAKNAPVAAAVAVRAAVQMRGLLTRAHARNTTRSAHQQQRSAISSDRGTSAPAVPCRALCADRFDVLLMCVRCDQFERGVGPECGAATWLRLLSDTSTRTQPLSACIVQTCHNAPTRWTGG